MKQNKLTKKAVIQYDSKPYLSDSGADLFFRNQNPDNRSVEEWAKATASKLKMCVQTYRIADEFEYNFLPLNVEKERDLHKIWYPAYYRKN